MVAEIVTDIVALHRGCPGEEDIAAYVGGHLPADATAALEAHVARCVACRQLLSALAEDAAEAPCSQAPTLAQVAAGRDLALPSGARFGRYVVLDRRGTGGMGVVYAAHDPELRRNVALKVLRGGGDAGDAATALGSGDAALRDLLLREAQAMAQLAHPNVVRVFDVGSVDGRVFLAMELVDGQTLRAWLATPRTPRAIIAAFSAAGQGLAAAHAVGMVHRDFKPDNVLIGDDGRICVTDFGLARLADHDAPGGAALVAAPPVELQASAIAGTPAYMAPEQARGHRPDARADQFSFAVALYEALYGARPYGDLDAALAGQVRPVPDRTRVPGRVRQALLRALRADPAARFPAMADLLDALAPRRVRARWTGAALVAIAALGFLGVHAVLGARRDAQDADAAALGSRWRDLAPALRARLQSAHMLPLHDIRPARDEVRAQLREVEQQLDTPAGRAQRALGQFVLGEGWRALGEPRRALAALEAAWDAGERGPHIDEALGSALVEVYDLALVEVETTAGPGERDARLHQLAARYRDPAMAHLRAALAARRGSPAYLEALIAFHDRRFAEAADQAHAMFAASPTSYEAGKLEALARNEHGRALLAAARIDDARRELAAARATFDRVLEIARSDDEAWLADGNMIYVQANALSRDGAQPDDLKTAAAAALHNVQRINPDNADAYIREAEIHLGQGNLEVLWGRDPSPHLDQTLRLVDEARRHGGDPATIDIEVCGAEWQRSMYQTGHGIDPRPALARGMAACERAAAQRGDSETRQQLAVMITVAAVYEGDHGRDPLAMFARADREELTAIAIRNDSGMHYNRARLAIRRARYELDHGGDPEPALALALSEFRTVIAMTANRADAFAGLADAMSIRAQYLAPRGDDLSATLGEARDALARAFAIDRYDPGIRYRLMLSDAEARSALVRGGDPGPAIARMRDDVRQLAARYPDDEYVHRMASRAELWAARQAIARRAPAGALLDRAAAEARRARDANPDEARAWLAGAEVEAARASARAAEVSARVAPWLDRALAIDPQLAGARALRDQLAPPARPPGPGADPR